MPNLEPPTPSRTPSGDPRERPIHDELIARLHQHGLAAFDFLDAADPAQLADLLSAVEGFERAVERAGGDLFVDTPDSSEPERPEFVIPHPHEDERIDTYTRRVITATEHLNRSMP